MREEIENQLDEIKKASVTDLPFSLPSGLACPMCQTPILESLSYDEIEKVRHWTLAQLLAWHHLMKNSGLSQEEALAQTAIQARPGIGAIVNPTVLGVNLHGMFVGIEPDGYTHS